ncbi:hypothetical protein QYE76_057202 [Lolium multiflorum]|uniref:Pentatricopeptide repeat-containing protein n=1 Tax=Lolium multiflorum TaxID=4521 RepID=A0AAD8T358_LOLMU|nr:hypothetical protein QYE76_057202 [Lolium multiflorum]
MASIASLTPREAEALCASNYPCPPGYRVPTGWLLSVGGVPVPPVPLGVAREMAITNHYYFELTPEQRRNPQWHPDYSPTWESFFINRRERALARHEEGGPPPPNFNEAGRRLWWRGRTLQGVMAYRGPRLRYPQSQPTRAHPPTFEYRDPDASDDDDGDYDDYSGDYYRARHEAPVSDADSVIAVAVAAAIAIAVAVALAVAAAVALTGRAVVAASPAPLLLSRRRPHRGEHPLLSIPRLPRVASSAAARLAGRSPRARRLPRHGRRRPPLTHARRVFEEIRPAAPPATLDGRAAPSSTSRATPTGCSVDAPAGVPPSVVTYNTMLRVYGDAGLFGEAVHLFGLMCSASDGNGGGGSIVKPNIVTYSTILSIWVKAGKLDRADKLFEKLQESGTEIDPVLYRRWSSRARALRACFA